MKIWFKEMYNYSPILHMLCGSGYSWKASKCRCIIRKLFIKIKGSINHNAFFTNIPPPPQFCIIFSYSSPFSSAFMYWGQDEQKHIWRSTYKIIFIYIHLKVINSHILSERQSQVNKSNYQTSF